MKRTIEDGYGGRLINASLRGASQAAVGLPRSLSDFRLIYRGATGAS